MAAVCPGQIDNQFQFTGGVVDVLSLERSFFRLSRPHHALVNVQQSIDGATYRNNSPARCLADLQQKTGRHCHKFNQSIYILGYQLFVQGGSETSNVVRVGDGGTDEKTGGGDGGGRVEDVTIFIRSDKNGQNQE